MLIAYDETNDYDGTYWDWRIACNLNHCDLSLATKARLLFRRLCFIFEYRETSLVFNLLVLALSKS